MTRYACIATDPPWKESGGGKIKRGADAHYPLLSTPEIVRVMASSPLWQPADDCHLWLWTTNNFLEQAFSVIRGLGFRYVTKLTWAKVKVTGFVAGPGNGTLTIQTQMGLGQYLRGSTEDCLFAVRGRLPALVRTQSSVLFADDDQAEVELPGGSLVGAARGRHSAKPQEAYDRIEAISPGPRLEMFARTPRPGWDVWGNEVGGPTP